MTRPTRRRVLETAAASAAALVLAQAAPEPAAAATWRLHDDTDQVGLRQLYSGSSPLPGCDTAENADCPGPGRISCYWGGLFVNSTARHRLRTGPFTGVCGATWPGGGGAERVRWAAHGAASAWTPEYRFVGQLYVADVLVRPDAWNGLVLHPVHLDNCNNYWIRLWERDDAAHVVWGREVDDDEEWILEAALPRVPRLGQWYAYEVRVLPESRIKFYWDGELVFDHTDPDRTFGVGPVGMRLDYFDATLAETRVYQP
jgi:hypothetical protein